ncbi:MAG TPA: glycosyl hydrolase, partial [Polyangiaceae bacterium]|nr:glycosyl hydrolase [Polyangiaceae bacterium]
MLLLAAMSACGGGQIDPASLPKHPPGKVKKAGAGFMLNDVPSDEHIAVDEKLKRAHPKLSKDFAGVVKTNTWWSSLIWQYDQKDPYSQNLFAHPLVARAFKDGLGISYPDVPTVTPREYMFKYAEDLRVGLEGLAAPDTHVAAYSDWAVTAEWSGSGSLRATIGHGMPFVYFTKTGGSKVVIKTSATPDVWKDSGETLGVTVNGHNYGLFAPAKSKWQKNGSSLECDLNGKDYFSVAILPSKGDDTLEKFRKHAYAFVTDTLVSWKYDEPSAKLSATYEFKTKLMDDQKGLSSDPIVALYPHLWKHASSVPYWKETYVSPRGLLKVAEVAKFTTDFTFNGILPALPAIPGADLGSVPRYLKESANADDLFPKGYGPRPTRDSYWVGKSLGRNASMIEIAEQLGLTTERERLLVGNENELIDWFDGALPRAFHYDTEWHSVVAFPSSYGSTDELNDHHFHYGYFIGAAANIAARDPKWTKAFGPFVDVLVRDVANWDRTSTRYPFMRHMDLYAGHSWANGPEHFDYGNNQEASSEDTNCSSAIILWGAATGRKEIRDLGIYLLVNQISAAEQYWFNIDLENFPKDFKHRAAGMIWGAGAKYDTWFDRDPALIHGINYLPFTGASLYLGRHPKYVQGAFDEIATESRGSMTAWRDYMLMYLALAAPEKARKMFDDDPYFEPEFGNTLAMTYDWIAKLATIGGHVDTSVTADSPLYAVFKGGGSRQYLGYNPNAEKLTVKFSD